MRHSAAFVGVGHSRVFRYDDVALGALAVEACRLAIHDAGLDVSQVDGVACVPEPPFEGNATAYDGREYVSVGYVIRSLGLEAHWGENVAGMISNSFVEAIHAVESGACSYVLVFRALHSPRGNYGHTSHESAGGPAQFTLPYGSFYPGTWSQMWHRYQAKYRSGSREQMATLVVQSRDNGLLWDHSYWRQVDAPSPSVEEYLGARYVSTPLSIYDCDIPVQGCGAFVVTTSERAADITERPAYVRGVSSPSFANSTLVEPIILEDEVEKGKVVASQLWERSGIRPSDVDIANLYDGFSIISMLWLESLGFCQEGEAFDFIQDGRIALDGSLPLNTSGGNLGAGRMHGVPHLMDSILQVMGRSGPRQVPDANLVLAAVGPQSHGPAILFGREPE